MIETKGQKPCMSLRHALFAINHSSKDLFSFKYLKTYLKASNTTHNRSIYMVSSLVHSKLKKALFYFSDHKNNFCYPHPDTDCTVFNGFQGVNIAVHFIVIKIQKKSVLYEMVYCISKLCFKSNVVIYKITYNIKVLHLIYITLLLI